MVTTYVEYPVSKPVVVTLLGSTSLLFMNEVIYHTCVYLVYTFTMLFLAVRSKKVDFNS